MRKMILFIIIISSLSAKAQSLSGAGFTDSIQRGALGNNSHVIENTWNKKWFLSTYSGISTGFYFLNGGNTSFIAAPLGLQLNRRLNNNFYAFTSISVAPAYINFNRSFLSSDVNKLNPGSGLFRSNSFGMYSRAELGLMYVNDAGTFSISGSIGVQRSGNPLFPYQPTSAAKRNPAIPSNR